MDGIYEYRHVILPREMAKGLPKGRTLSEQEWRGSGIQQSRGWEHYAVHRYLLTEYVNRADLKLYICLLCRPEPHILLFRRPLGTDPVSGEVDPELEREAKQQYQQELAMNMHK